MKFLANENFPVKSFQLLQSAGIDVIHIGLEFPAVTDEEVIDLAIKQERIIVTFDNDYGTLVFRRKMKPPGVIYLRFKEFTPGFPAECLMALFKSNLYSLEGMFTVVNEKEHIRQRKIEY